MAISLTTPLAPSGGQYVASAGDTVKLVARGATAVQTDRLNPAVYYYVVTAPPTSGLQTLDQLDELLAYTSGTASFYSGPLPLSTERKSLRLKVDRGSASFKPDVPGRYVLRVYDVTEYRFVPHWQGNVPGAGENAEEDNELAALPAYAGGTAQATSADLVVWVGEDVTFTIGVAPDTAILRVRTFSDTIDQTKPERVSLTPAKTTLAKIAATNRDVILAVDAVRLLSAPFTTTTFAKDAVIGWGPIDGATPSPRLWDMIAVFNVHRTQTISYTTHTAGDATNGVASPAATDVATSIALLNDLRAKYEAHRVLTAGSVHLAPDATNAVSAAAATDFRTALALWNDLYVRITRHGTRGTVHNATTGIPVDGAMGEWIEPPLYQADLPGKCNTLVTLYEQHRVKTTNGAPHAAADSDNVLSSLVYDLDGKNGIYDAINAFADALERHAANLKPDGSAAGSAYHTNAQKLKVPTRAVDPASAEQTLAFLLLRMEDHFLNTNSHGSKALGTSRPNQTGEPRWPYAARVGRAWERAINAITPAVPSNLNNSAVILHGYGSLRRWHLPAPASAAVPRHRVVGGEPAASVAIPLRQRLLVARLDVGRRLLPVGDADRVGFAGRRVCRLHRLARVRRVPRVARHHEVRVPARVTARARGARRSAATLTAQRARGASLARAGAALTRLRSSRAGHAPARARRAPRTASSGARDSTGARVSRCAGNPPRSARHRPAGSSRARACCPSAAGPRRAATRAGSRARGARLRAPSAAVRGLPGGPRRVCSIARARRRQDEREPACKSNDTHAPRVRARAPGSTPAAT